MRAKKLYFILVGFIVATLVIPSSFGFSLTAGTDYVKSLGIKNSALDKIKLVKENLVTDKEANTDNKGSRGWSIETVDSTGIQGRWGTSIALDSNNCPHISYEDDTNWHLKYAEKTGSSWSVTTVDSSYHVGRSSSIALDTSDYPHISYLDSSNEALKYAKWTGSSWSITTVDSGPHVGEYTSIALDSSDNPHISYMDWSLYNLKYAKWTGSSWSISTVDSTGDVGFWTSIALDSSNRPYISYYDYTNEDLKLAHWTGSSWSISTLDSSGDVGWYTSIALDSGNHYYISYLDMTNYNLKCIRWTGSQYVTETVDSSGDVGVDTSIALDSNSRPRISYCDMTNGDLKYAKYTGSSWSVETVDSSGDTGQYTDIAIDSSDNPHISYHDATNYDLKYAKYSATRTITFYTDPTNAGTITFNGNTYSNGQSTQINDGTYSITANPATSYTFSHWSSTGGVSVSDPYSQTTTATITGDGTLKAHFTYNPPQRTITFYTDPTNAGTITFNGNTYSNGQSTQINDGTYSITANPASNYIFSYWSSTGGVSIANPNSQTTTATITGDGTLKAHFTYNPSQHTITFYTDPTNAGTITFNGNTYSNGQTTQEYNGTYSITANPASNYIFSYWSSTSGVSVANPNSQTTTATITGDGTLKAWFTSTETAQWTVIAYLCGDNNLDFWCQDSLNFMKNVGSQNGIQIIALIDGAGSSDTHAYHVLHNNLVNIPLDQINPGWNNEVNMGDPQVLISFSTYCINNYPANHYMVIPQDHGGSWVGCCWDDHGDNLNINELKTAFQQISNLIGGKLDMVFFNDCLMNSVEIAYQLSPYVQFQAGSETVSWTSTCDNQYQDILQNMVNNPTITPQDLANYITNTETPNDSPSYRTQSISTISLDNMQSLSLVTNVDQLSHDLYNKLDNSTYRAQIKTSRDQSEYTEGPYGGDIERLIDLYDFVSRINTYVTDPSTKALAQNIMEIIGPSGGQNGYTITDERHTASTNFCHGMSIYFPDRTNRYSGDYLDGNNFASSTYWNEFLSKYLSQGASESWGWDANIRALAKDGDAYFTFGEDNNATDGFDNGIDIQHSEQTATNVDIYSVNNGIEYSVDIRYGPNTNKAWDVDVKWQGSDSTTVILTWDVSLITNDEYTSVILYDYTGGKQVNMRSATSYSFDIGAGETRNMKIICSSGESNPPVKPQPPSGPASVKRGKAYTYNAVTIDPDGDLISYIFDWGDGTKTQTEFIQSGKVASADHKWTKKGSYQIKVKAIDEHGLESDWSNPLPIKTPRILSFESLLIKLLERFPHAFPILRHLLGL